MPDRCNTFQRLSAHFAALVLMCLMVSCSESDDITYMIRSGDWKLLISRLPDADSIDALYNLKNDPGEMKNLLFEGMPEPRVRIAADLKSKLISWLEETGSLSVQGVKDRKLPGSLVLR